MGQVRHLSRGVGAFVGFTWSSRIQGRSPSLPMVSCVPAGSRSGSLALTHSLLDLGRHRLVLEVFRSLRAVGLLAKPAAWPPWPFAPVQSSCPARAGPKSDLPLLGFVTVGTLLRAPPSRPFIDMASGVHSHATLRPRFGVEGATLAACSVLVVSRHLDGFLLRNFAGLLRPAADPGVRRVSGDGRLGSSRSDTARFVRATRISRRADRRCSRDARSLPFEECPRSLLFRVTAAVASSRVGDAASPLPALLRSFLPGLVPFEVLFAPFRYPIPAEAGSSPAIPRRVRIAAPAESVRS